MQRAVCKDVFRLGRPSREATVLDIPIANDLMDTLKANADRCVGMAANMIGQNVRIIVFLDVNTYKEMFNPVITAKSKPFETEEGCLSLTGERKTTRYQKITVRYMDRTGKMHTGNFAGWTAQIIKHECDHLEGIII